MGKQAIKRWLKALFSRLSVRAQLRVYLAKYQNATPILAFVKEVLAAPFAGESSPVPSDCFVSYDHGVEIYDPETLLVRLMDFDVVSFDLFDTVLFRKAVKPTDIFWEMEETMSFPGFAQRRVEAERQARLKKRERCGSSEVTLEEIYKAFPSLTTAECSALQREELSAERGQLSLNPVMKEIIERLQAVGKPMLVISDMYLSGEVLGELLGALGCFFPKALYVSCDHGVSKSDGGLFALVAEQEAYHNKRVAHIGDQFHSDVLMGKNTMTRCFHYVRNL